MNDDIKKLLGVSPAMERILEDQKRYDRMLKSMAPLRDFTFPKVTSPDFRMPDIHIPSPREQNAYQSASVLMKSIADEALQWKQRLSAEYRPAVLAILYGGTQIDVQTLSQVSFHGIRIEGTLGKAPCSLLAHQSTVQLLCYAVEADPKERHNPIGFVWGDNKVKV